MRHTVLITGATGGIGSAAARLFAAQGARVILHYHHAEDTARALTEELSRVTDVTSVQADIADRAQVERMFRQAR